MSKSYVVKDYLLAVENEIVVDKKIYDFFMLEYDAYSGMPRPTKWIGLNKFNTKLIQSVFYFVSIFWKYVLFYFYIFYNVVASFFAVFRKDSKKNDFLCSDRCGVLFSQRAGEVFESLPPNESVNVCISMPWAKGYKVKKSLRVISIFNLINFLDVLEAAWLACIAHNYMIKDAKLSSSCLQSYTAYRWFLVYIALNKIKSNLYIAEHFDRWAILANSLVKQWNSLNPLGEKFEFHQIQHGSVTGLTLNDSNFAYSFRNKITEVSHLHIYDDRSKNIFLNEIIGNLSVVTSCIESKIVLVDVDVDVSQVVVLFVGHKICEDFHIRLLYLLKEKTKFNAYYKPHPTSTPSSQIHFQSWDVITDNKFYPRVDLLISYPSTMVHEYALHGIRSVVHSLNQELSSSDFYCDKIAKELISVVDLKRGNSSEY